MRVRQALKIQVDCVFARLPARYRFPELLQRERLLRFPVLSKSLILVCSFASDA
jgi:hypothetical protein